jgi:hypothetical protein
VRQPDRRGDEPDSRARRDDGEPRATPRAEAFPADDRPATPFGRLEGRAPAATPGLVRHLPSAPAEAPAEAPTIEVRIGSIEILPPPSPPAPRPRREPRGFGDVALTRRHLDRRWY